MKHTAKEIDQAVDAFMRDRREQAATAEAIAELEKERQGRAEQMMDASKKIVEAMQERGIEVLMTVHDEALTINPLTRQLIISKSAKSYSLNDEEEGS